jgi:hypothetical protein
MPPGPTAQHSSSAARDSMRIAATRGADDSSGLVCNAQYNDMGTSRMRLPRPCRGATNRCACYAAKSDLLARATLRPAALCAARR